MSENVFADDWRDCLRAHYMYVVRENDRVTLPTLTMVMRDAGFSDSELAELRVRATMRMEDVDPEFMPDLDVLRSADSQAGADPFSVAVAEMRSATPEEPIDQVNDDSQEVEDPLIEDDRAAEEAVESPGPDPDGPQQLSLF